MSFHSTYSPNFDSLITVGALSPTKTLGANTLACWVNFNSLATDGEIIEINATGGGNGSFDSAILYSFASSKLEFTQRSSTQNRDFVATFTVTTGTWIHVALTWDGTNLLAYANGVQIGSNTTGALTGTRGNWANLQVGPGTCDLQDAVFYDAALSAAEIQQLYVSRLPTRRTNLVVHLPCFPGSNRNVDYSGNGYNFSNQGTPTDSTITPPSVGWGGSRPRLVIPANSALAAAGSVQCTGASTLVAGKAVVPGGSTQVTGAANMLRGMNVAGATQTTGAATLTKSAPIAAAGLTQTTGAAAVSASGSYSLTAAGSTQVSGTATSSTAAPLAAAGLTRVSGAAIEGGASPIAGGGTTRCTGSAVVSSSAPAATAYAVHLWRRSRRGR